MTPMHVRIRPRGGLGPNVQRIAAIALGVAALAGCFDPKTRTFFDPFTGRDIIPPVITFLTATGTVLNDDKVCINVTDQGGSGLDAVTATSGTTTLPVQAGAAAGDFDVGISAAVSGLQTVRVNATDNAGNESTGSIDIIKDVDDPAISDFIVPSDQSSGASSLTLNWSWGIGDGNLLNISGFRLRTAGNDGIVGNSDDQDVQQGTGGGQADNPVQEVTCPDANCSANVTIFNGVTMPGGSATRIYYAMVDASDTAKNCRGQDNPNTATANSPPSSITWLGPPGSMFPTGVQIPGTYAWTLNRTSATSGCPAALPASGTDTKTFNSGNVGVTGLDPQQTSPILGAYNETNGTYSGSASVLLSNGFRVNTSLSGIFTFQGQNISFSGEMVRIHIFPSPPAPPNTVACEERYNATQTRPLTPSSRRFKRDVVGLLPEGRTLVGLRPVTFRYVEPYGEPSITRIGLIAEEVVRVYPEAVALDADGRPAAIDYTALAGRVIETLETRAGQALSSGVTRLAEKLE